MVGASASAPVSGLIHQSPEQMHIASLPPEDHFLPLCTLVPVAGLCQHTIRRRVSLQCPGFQAIQVHRFMTVFRNGGQCFGGISLPPEGFAELVNDDRYRRRPVNRVQPNATEETLTRSRGPSSRTLWTAERCEPSSLQILLPASRSGCAASRYTVMSPALIRSDSILPSPPAEPCEAANEKLQI